MDESDREDSVRGYDSSSASSVADFAIPQPAEIPSFTSEVSNNAARVVHANILRHGCPAIKFPWETGSFATVFGGSAFPGFDYQCTPPLTANIKDQEIVHHPLVGLTPRIMAGTLRRVRFLSWPQQQESQRHKALLRWRLIVEENLDCSSLGLQLQSAAANLVPDSELTDIISHSFANKATGTLTKRGTPMLKYLTWHRKTYGTAGLPFQEHHVYQYMKELKQGKCAPTVLSSFLSAVGFARHVVSITGSDTVLASLRVQGLAHEHYLTKRPLKQAKVLTVVQVQILEDLVRCAPDAMDRIAAGFFCAQLHSRARFSDLQRSSKIIADFNDAGVGYLEFSSLLVKTSKSKEAKSMFMPFVAPCHGVLSQPWAIHWMRERKAQGLPCEDCTFLLPLPGANGQWLNEAASSRFATKWLKSLLISMGQTVEETDVSTHSLKGTPLSWAAKFGLSFQVRQMLGHHVPGDKMSALTYSRDAQAYPVREYQRVLDSIRSLRFAPDSSRSGLFTRSKRARVEPNSDQAPRNPAEPEELLDEEGSIPQAFDWTSEAEEFSAAVHEPVVVPQEVAVGDDWDDKGSESEDSSSSSDSSADDEALRVLSRGKLKETPVPDGCRLFVCVKSGLLHARINDDARLACGKTLSGSYKALTSSESIKNLRCIPCFSKVKAIQP